MSVNNQQQEVYLAMLNVSFARQLTVALENAANAARALTEELREQNRLLEERQQLREQEELGF